MGANNRESDDTNGYNPLQKLQYESEEIDVGYGLGQYGEQKNASQMTPKHKSTTLF